MFLAHIPPFLKYAVVRCFLLVGSTLQIILKIF